MAMGDAGCMRGDDWWKPLQEMPPGYAVIPMDTLYREENFLQICLGFRPREMEEKWFAFYEAPWLHMHRSWSGYAIYRVRFQPEPGGYRAVELHVNRDRKQWAGRPDAEEV